MYHPTTRVLTVLELLQAHGSMTGAELARRLEVDIRTARRYITMLQDLGIPIEGQRGRYGSYTLRPGFKLPPMMFTEDEAVALTLGLLTIRRLGMVVATPAVEGALAKVERVLPSSVRQQVQAVQDTLVIDHSSLYVAPAGSVVSTLSEAAQQRKRVRLVHRSRQGKATDREFDPYGIVYYDGRWFVAGYCHSRQDMRMFRLDRVQLVELLSETFERPANFNVYDYVMDSLATTSGYWEIELVLHIPLGQAQSPVPPSLATLEDTPAGIVMRCSVQSLDWFAQQLLGLDCPLTIRKPVELRSVLRELAHEIMHIAEATEESVPEHEMATMPKHMVANLIER